MNFKLTKKPVPTLTVSGEIDHFNAHVINSAIHEVCAAGPTVILNLKDVVYIDSAGIQSIFMASRFTSENGGSVCVVTKNEDVSRIIGIAATGIPNVKMLPDLKATKSYLKEVK